MQKNKIQKNEVKGIISKNYEEFDIITKFKKLENLKVDELNFQKNLYLQRLESIENKYSIDNFKNNLKKIYYARHNIKKKLDKNTLKLKNIAKNLKTVTKYYMSDRILFPAKKVLSSIILKKSTAEEIFNIEKNNLEILNEKSFQNLLLYFHDLNKLIYVYYHLFNIEIFKNNSASWYEHLQNKNIFINPYDFIKNYHLTFNYYIYEKFDELSKKDKMNYLENIYIFNNDAKYVKPTGGEIVRLNYTPTYAFYDDNKYIEYNKYLYDENSWGDYFHRVDDTHYSKKLTKNEKMQSIHISINKLKSYENELFSNQKIYKKFHINCSEILKRYIRKIDLLIRSQLSKSEKQTNIGKIYIMKNKAFPGMYKIGSTYGSVDERAEGLSGTNLPYPWIPDYFIRIKDAEYYEKQIHKLLKNFRFRKDREFFKLDVKKIKICLNEISKLSDKGKIKLKPHIIKKTVNF